MRPAIFARLAVLEAWRGALPWLAVASIALAVGVGAFLSQLALTESRLVQAAVVAALLRACAAFALATHVVASVQREVSTKGLELMLSLPLGRPAQYVGRLAGHAACGALLACAYALPLVPWTEPVALACWTVSLAFELALVAAAALFFAMTLRQLVSALAATAALYLLGRSVSAMQAIAAGPLLEESFTHELARRAIDGVALLLPELDGATRTAWLLYGIEDWRAYAMALGGMLVYTLLLAAAGAFDFARRSA
jgi:hypothetical protein